MRRSAGRRLQGCTTDEAITLEVLGIAVIVGVGIYLGPEVVEAWIEKQVKDYAEDFAYQEAMAVIQSQLLAAMGPNVSQAAKDMVTDATNDVWDNIQSQVEDYVEQGALQLVRCQCSSSALVQERATGGAVAKVCGMTSSAMLNTTSRARCSWCAARVWCMQG
jgi:predicted metalloprotease